jgi:hypothetical protein
MAIHAIARIHFYETSQGGMTEPIVPIPNARVPRFGACFQIGDAQYGGWVLTPSEQIGPAGKIDPGQTFNLPLVFAFPENVIPILRVGLKFFVTTSGIIADAEILEILEQHSLH